MTISLDAVHDFLSDVGELKSHLSDWEMAYAINIIMERKARDAFLMVKCYLFEEMSPGAFPNVTQYQMQSEVQGVVRMVSTIFNDLHQDKEITRRTIKRLFRDLRGLKKSLETN